MRLQVRLRDSLLQDGHTDAIKRYARFALGRFEHRISRTELALEDVNGPRQGPDKRCKVQVLLNGLPPIVVEVIDTDAMAAVNRALDRAARHVRDRLNRERDLRRQSSAKNQAYAG
jgi:ribosome-associated translation inhibitor RaiA